MIKSVLIIEDDRFIGEMYVRSLELSGYSVEWAIDGNDGLVMARNKPYDLIIVDIMLPERKGDEILSALRGEEDLIPSTKVLIMTNFQQDEESRKAIENRADGYLIKADITPRKLLEIIKGMWFRLNKKRAGEVLFAFYSISTDFIISINIVRLKPIDLLGKIATQPTAIRISVPRQPSSWQLGKLGFVRSH